MSFWSIYYNFIFIKRMHSKVTLEKSDQITFRNFEFKVLKYPEELILSNNGLCLYIRKFFMISTYNTYVERILLLTIIKRPRDLVVSAVFLFINHLFVLMKNFSKFRKKGRFIRLGFLADDTFSIQNTCVNQSNLFKIVVITHLPL